MKQVKLSSKQQKNNRINNKTNYQNKSKSKSKPKVTHSKNPSMSISLSLYTDRSKNKNTNSIINNAPTVLNNIGVSADSHNKNQIKMKEEKEMLNINDSMNASIKQTFGNDVDINSLQDKEYEKDKINLQHNEHYKQENDIMD